MLTCPCRDVIRGHTEFRRAEGFGSRLGELNGVAKLPSSVADDVLLGIARGQKINHHCRLALQLICSHAHVVWCLMLMSSGVHLHVRLSLMPMCSCTACECFCRLFSCSCRRLFSCSCRLFSSVLMLMSSGVSCSCRLVSMSMFCFGEIVLVLECVCRAWHIFSRPCSRCGSGSVERALF